MRNKERKESWTKRITEMIEGKPRPREAKVRKTPKKSKKRRALEDAYKASQAEVPESVACAACGGLAATTSMERHHPSGRTHGAFCFYVMLHSGCHRKVHDDPAWAEKNGLLRRCRNSLDLTLDDAAELVGLMPCSPDYSLRILERYQIK